MTIALNFPFEKAKAIKLVVFDVDGVLTRGDILIDDQGVEQKAFNVRDGHGIKMMQRAGIQPAILTGRTSTVVEHRARELGISCVVQGSLNKGHGMQDILKQTGLSGEHCAFMGDDIVDLPAMAHCALAFAPSDAHPAVLAKVDWQSDFPGGAGAVRQAVEGLILANGSWPDVVAGPYGVQPEDAGWQMKNASI